MPISRIHQPCPSGDKLCVLLHDNSERNLCSGVRPNLHCRTRCPPPRNVHKVVRNLVCWAAHRNNKQEPNPNFMTHESASQNIFSILHYMQNTTLRSQPDARAKSVVSDRAKAHLVVNAAQTSCWSPRPGGYRATILSESVCCPDYGRLGDARHHLWLVFHRPARSATTRATRLGPETGCRQWYPQTCPMYVDCRIAPLDPHTQTHSPHIKL